MIGEDYIPMNRSGEIISQTDWMALMQNVNAFYANNTDNDICETNKEMRIQLKEQYREYTENAQKKERTIKNGYVYLLKEVNGEHHKIGKTIDLKNRIKMFNVKLPFEVELIHTIRADDYDLAEELAHIHFAKKRVKGEWFLLDEQDIENFKSVSSFVDGSFMVEAQA